MVLEYGREDSGGIPGFLEWWEVSGCDKTLHLPNIKNFIRISSIHQSKGLEYHTVFIPFCSWEVALNSNKLPYIWTMPDAEPFNQLKMVLLKCDKNLKNSIFSYDYCRELLFSVMDNLNLLYVAMTRAISNLYVIAPYKDAIKQVGTVAELIQTLIEFPILEDTIDQQKYLDFTKHWDPLNKVFEFGQLEFSSIQVTSPLPEHPIDPLILNANGKRMEIRLHSKEYFLLTGDEKTERINKGTVMHQIFEKIKSTKDIGLAVSQAVKSGLLTAHQGNEISEKIEALLHEMPYSDWFSGHWKVLNERDILRVGESKHRPDRVMLKGNSAVVIDYKTGEKTDKDIRQMKGYLIDLKKMGYTSCEGNIWYLENNELTKVDIA
jgi:ATP-dependent exoDNAse (exonuclease V) beta subunit